MITTDYRVTAVCDTCGKSVSTTSSGTPPMQTVPHEWVQGSPPGTQNQKEFCSVVCMGNWKSVSKPWEETDESPIG